MLDKIFHWAEDSRFGLRERLIRRMMVIGIIVIPASFIEVFFFTTTYWAALPLMLLVLTLAICLLLTYKFLKVEIAAGVIGVMVIGFVFPSIFFLSGGIEGGAAIWFVIGIFYTIGMYDGTRMIVYTILAILVDIATYTFGYFHPEYIIHMSSESEKYCDSLFAIILVGVMMGAITKYQLHAYGKERQTALEQKEEIEKFSDSKSAFFASMSHEIRTPINTIIGLNEMILREDDISKETVENAITIQNASKMLLSLVNDILDLSQIESKKMEIMPVRYNTKEMFQELVEMIQVRMKEKNLGLVVNIDPDIPLELFGDDKRIKQVLLNLLTNAVKYTKEGTVTLSAKCESIGQEWCKLIVSVADTGVGIKKENLESLFDSFQRVQNEENRKIEGTGLGLSISKQLVELMDGQIMVDSIYTKGSVFTVMLEQQTKSEEKIGYINFLEKEFVESQTYQQSFEAPEARILVVDDNEMNRMVVSKLLRATKVQLDFAISGTQCLEMTRTKYYNVIFMDYMMPGMDGVETLKEVRRQENGLCRETPIVVLTADSSISAGNRYLEYGFDGMIEKPFRGVQLEESILNFLPNEILEYRFNVPKSGASHNNENILISKRRQKKIGISVDCVSDITDDWCSKYDIKKMYLYINTEKCRFRDTKEINSDSLGKFLSDRESLATAEAASVEDYEKFFAECLIEAEEVIHISLGSKMGKSYHNAMQASRGFGHVHVIDSGHLSGGMALVTMRAAQMVSQGREAREICSEIERVQKNVSSYFFMPASDIFYKNGYINAITGKLLGKLHLHPKIRAKNAALNICGFQFGDLNSSRRKFVRSILKYNRVPINDIVYITHAGLSVQQQEQILQEIKKYANFERIIMQKCCVTNACFSGLGTIGVAFMNDR